MKAFSVKWREEYLNQLPAEEERRMMRRLYRQFDHALLEWKETLKRGGAGWKRLLGGARI
jgi:hypothetical protein